MAKNFFMSYRRVKEKLSDYENESSSDTPDEFRVYKSQNYNCLKALEKYLYSYRWCKNDNEKILLQSINSYKTAEVIAQENGISYNNYRAISSRVSRRLYEQLGADFAQVILGNDKKEQDKLIRRCIARCEDFEFSILYPEFLFSKMKEIAEGQEVVIDENFKIRAEDMGILKFLSDYSKDGILQSISLLDQARFACFYKILTDKTYFNQRVEILEYIRKFNQRLTREQKHHEAVLALNRGVLIPKKEYAEFLQYKEAKKNEDL